MKVAILGAGALGSVLAGLWSKSGQTVELWGREGPHLRAIGDSGLKLETPEGIENIPVPISLVSEAKETPDLIILLTKTPDTETALASVKKHIAAGAKVMTMQNGIGLPERIAKLVPEDQVLYGTTMLNGRIVAPGHVFTQGKGDSPFASLTPAGAVFARRMEILGDAVPLRFSPDADRVIWKKAAFVCGMNPVCALSGGRIGLMGEVPSARQLARAISAEAVALAQARGVALTLEEIHEQIDSAITHHGQHQTSMTQDFAAGRATEIESLNGEVARQCAERGLDAPLNEAIAALVRLRTKVVTEKPG